MDAATRRALCSAFGTQPEADDAIIIQRAQAVAAELAQQREACARLTTDLTNANQQLTEARTRIEEQERAAFTSEVEQLLSRASETGQLTPAMVPNWREFCSQSRANFEMFRDKLLPTMPKLAPASRAPASQTPPTSNTPTTSPTSNSRRERNSVSGRLHGLGMTDEEIARADAYNAEVMARVEED